jgi:hypothetical protein
MTWIENSTPAKRSHEATPLLWLSVLKDELKDQRNDFEDLNELLYAKIAAMEGKRNLVWSTNIF